MVAEKIIVPLLKDSPYKAEELLTKAYKHHKLGGKIAADFVWSHLSHQDREIIKAKAEEAKKSMFTHKEHKHHREAVLVNHKVAEILKKLGLGVPEHKKVEAVIVDKKVGELIEALHLGKPEHAQAWLI